MESSFSRPAAWMNRERNATHAWGLRFITALWAYRRRSSCSPIAGVFAGTSSTTNIPKSIFISSRKRFEGAKEIIEFKTNDVVLTEFCKAHPEKRDDFLNLAKGAKFPSVK